MIGKNKQFNYFCKKTIKNLLKVKYRYKIYF